MLKLMNEKGQTILEALVALGVGVIIVSAITVAVITAVRNADFSKNQNLATQFAQQGMDIVRQISESNWSTFSQNDVGTWCLAQDYTELNVSSPCSKNIKDSNGNLYFIRQITVKSNGNCINGAYQVTSSVSWSDGSCQNNNYCHQVTLNSCFANLDAAPAP